MSRDVIRPWQPEDVPTREQFIRSYMLADEFGHAGAALLRVAKIGRPYPKAPAEDSPEEEAAYEADSSAWVAAENALEGRKGAEVLATFVAGKSWQEIAQLAGAAASESLQRDPFGYLHVRPEHVTCSLTVRWVVSPSGDVLIEARERSLDGSLEGASLLWKVSVSRENPPQVDLQLGNNTRLFLSGLSNREEAAPTFQYSWGRLRQAVVAVGGTLPPDPLLREVAPKGGIPPWMGRGRRSAAKLP